MTLSKEDFDSAVKVLEELNFNATADAVAWESQRRINYERFGGEAAVAQITSYLNVTKKVVDGEAFAFQVLNYLAAMGLLKTPV